MSTTKALAIVVRWKLDLIYIYQRVRSAKQPAYDRNPLTLPCDKVEFEETRQREWSRGSCVPRFPLRSDSHSGHARQLRTSIDGLLHAAPVNAYDTSISAVGGPFAVPGNQIPSRSHRKRHGTIEKTIASRHAEFAGVWVEADDFGRSAFPRPEERKVIVASSRVNNLARLGECLRTPEQSLPAGYQVDADQPRDLAIGVGQDETLIAIRDRDRPLQEAPAGDWLLEPAAVTRIVPQAHDCPGAGATPAGHVEFRAGAGSHIDHVGEIHAR